MVCASIPEFPVGRNFLGGVNGNLPVSASSAVSARRIEFIDYVII